MSTTPHPPTELLEAISSWPARDAYEMNVKHMAEQWARAVVNENKRLKSEVDELMAENDRLTKVHHRITQWCKAYPLDVFPEPDMEEAAGLLKGYGINLDAISASNMRHVLNGIQRIIDGGT